MPRFRLSAAKDHLRPGELGLVVRTGEPVYRARDGSVLLGHVRSESRSSDWVIPKVEAEEWPMRLRA